MSNSFDLPKWPELRVVGTRVSEDQAKEIIIRTDYSAVDPSSNDDGWCDSIKEVLGIPVKTGIESWESFQQKIEKFKESFGWIKEIEYLRPSRITSHYVGGSKGWIDWDGTIGTTGHNIGKWPKAEEVLNDWSLIAKVFPYLSLRAQLFSGEQCEEQTIPVVEYNIDNGGVVMVPPGDPIPVFFKRNLESEATQCLMRGSERFCRLDLLEEAMLIAKSKMTVKA